MIQLEWFYKINEKPAFRLTEFPLKIKKPNRLTVGGRCENRGKISVGNGSLFLKKKTIRVTNTN